MTIERVASTPEAEGRAIAALTLAFIRDPVMRYLFPEPQSYLSHFPTFARAFGAAAFGSGTAWTSGDQGGTALWLPAGVHPDGDAIAAFVFSAVDEKKHGVVASVLEQMGAYHPTDPHWYLPIIGVDAAHQGKGLGSQLLKVALDRCDAEGLDSYLESSNPANISLYQRHGFEVVGEILQGDCPPITPMFRSVR